jgi:hypothetical protein
MQSIALPDDLCFKEGCGKLPGSNPITADSLAVDEFFSSRQAPIEMTNCRRRKEHREKRTEESWVGQECLSHRKWDIYMQTGTLDFENRFKSATWGQSIVMKKKNDCRSATFVLTLTSSNTEDAKNAEKRELGRVGRGGNACLTESETFTSKPRHSI